MSYLDDGALARLRALSASAAAVEGDLVGGRFELAPAMPHEDPAARPDAAAVARELAALEAALGAPPAPDAAPRLPVGTLVAGKYRVEGTLGEGGMGVILLARHLELGRPVALKVLRARRGHDDAARLLREAQALSRLESEHVARIMDVGRLDDGAPYLVIERLVGSDLARRLRERGPFAPAEAVEHLLQACEALAEAHALGIVHRDLKPSNLFLIQRKDGSPCVKVLDFGISKVPGEGPDAAEERSLTSPTAVMGSAWYMSPEQLRSSKHVDARTDIWALGVVLHELIAGSPPFDAETAAGVGARIAAGEPVRLSAARPDAPVALEAVILRCLAKAPEERYQDVAALARALGPFAEGSRPSVERIERLRCAQVPAPDALAAPEPTVAKGTTSSAWGAPRAPTPRATMAARAAVVIVVLAAGVIALRAPRSPPSLPAAATPAASPTASLAPAPAEPASARPPAPAPAATVAPTPPRAAAALPRPARPALTASAGATASAPPAPPPASPTPPPATVDVRNPALDGR